MPNLFRCFQTVNVLCALFISTNCLASTEMRVALERLQIMVKVRVLLTGEYRAQLASAKYALQAKSKNNLRALQASDAQSAIQKVSIISQELNKLVPMLSDSDEREMIHGAVVNLQRFLQASMDTADRNTQEDWQAVQVTLQATEDILRTFETLAPKMDQDPDSRLSIIKRVDDLSAVAKHIGFPNNLTVILALQRTIIQVAPVFSRHSIAKLCAQQITELHQ